jgi:hypothetical protein
MRGILLWTLLFWANCMLAFSHFHAGVNSDQVLLRVARRVDEQLHIRRDS